MGKLRALQPDDVPRIVDLYRNVFTTNRDGSDEDLAHHFLKIYFEHPWYDDRFSCFLYEEPKAGVVGFVGATPRPMIFRGAQILVAIGSNYMVHPDHRNSLAGLSLMKSFLSGPQDLSVAEGNHLTRRLWLGFSGSTSLIQSVQWVCPLRPLQYAAQHSNLPRGIAAALDALIERIPGSPFRRSAPSLIEGELSVADYLECLSSCQHEYQLRPQYEEDTTRWLFDMLHRKNRLGIFQKTSLRDSSGRIRGCYLWYLKRGDLAHLVQIIAKEQDLRDVFAHLVHAAWESGSVALTGRLEPQLIDTVPHSLSLIARKHTWMMIHSSRKELMHSIHTGNALISRLEGEWWTSYHEEQNAAIPSD